MIDKKTLLLGVTIFFGSLILQTANLIAYGVPKSAIRSLSPPPAQTFAQTASTYIVKLGDTVSGIAYKSRMSISQLLEYNPSLRTNLHLVRVGQVINLRPNLSAKKNTTVSVSSHPLHPQKNTFDSFNISNQRRTGSSRTGAKRESAGSICFKNREDKLRALLPDDSAAGYTLRDYPTFFWYLPELTSESIPVKFILRPVVYQGTEESLGYPIYKTTFNSYSPGIQSFTLPEQAPALKEGQEYQWEILVECTKRNVALIKGRITRNLTDNAVLATKLEQAPIEDYPAILAEAGIWYDSLATVAELRRANPKESFWTKDWTEILKGIGFEDITTVTEKPL